MVKVKEGECMYFIFMNENRVMKLVEIVLRIGFGRNDEGE
jgi:hypothetical protein